MSQDVFCGLITFGLALLASASVTGVVLWTFLMSSSYPVSYVVATLLGVPAGVFAGFTLFAMWALKGMS